VKREKDKSISCFGLSVLLHSSLVFAVTAAPQLMSLPEGTVQADAIEFTTIEAPKGDQIKTVDIGDVESDMPTQPAVKPQPKVKPQAETNPVVVAKKHRPKKAKPIAKKEIPKKLPPKKVEVAKTPDPITAPVEEAPEVETAIAKNTEGNEVYTGPTEAEIQDDTPVESTETNKEDTKPEPTAEADDKSTFDDELANEVNDLDQVAQQEAARDIKKDDLLQKAQTQNEPLVTSNKVKPSQDLTHESNMAYGVPSGVRDYKDLEQLPGNAPPQYPKVARLRHEEGEVKLIYYVTSAGYVTNVKIYKSSGYPILDREAKRAISKHRYRPGQQGYTLHPVSFTLKGLATPAGGRLRTSTRNDYNDYNRNITN